MTASGLLGWASGLRAVGGITEALDVAAPDEVLAPWAVVGQTAGVDPSSDRHVAHVELDGGLLDRQQLITVHATEGTALREQDNTLARYTDYPVNMYNQITYFSRGGVMPVLIDLTGRRFGRLVVERAVERTTPAGKRRRYWLCRCDCGSGSTAETSNLTSGNTTSCGCFRIEKKRVTGRTHGGVGTRVYSIWKSMIQRCTNPNNPRWMSYGGRGITVCADWQTFENFRRDMGDPPEGTSIDRIDNDQGYEPGNCRWATSQTQNRNRRSSRPMTFQGKTRTLSEWSEELGIPYFTIHARLRRGATDEEALSAPVRRWPR